MIFYQDLQAVTDAADAGEPEAQYELALGYITGFCRGEAIPPDSTLAYHWMIQAAEQGHASAMESIGRAFMNGYIGLDAGRHQMRIDRGAALSWLQKALVAGAPEACRSLGLYYRYEDPHKAVEYFYKAAYYYGDVQALRYYGEALCKGDGAAQDEDAGRQVLCSAFAMDDDVSAEDAAQVLAAYGCRVVPVTDEADRADRRQKAEEYYITALRRRALAGDPAGQYELAMRFYLGRGMVQDMTQACLWLQKAATAGYAPAARQMAAMDSIVRH